MAFTTRRGRPRAPVVLQDLGTPELRLKHALGLTAEPIDLCLERGLISNEQHWCGLHLRWLYTLRYGAPSVTTRYVDRHGPSPAPEETVAWRVEREAEYTAASALLKQHRRYEAVMRLCVFNESPAFLSRALQQRAWNERQIAEQLLQSHHKLTQGLDILAKHWHRLRPANQNSI